MGIDLAALLSIGLPWGSPFPAFSASADLAFLCKRLILHGSRVPYPAKLIPYRSPFHFQISLGAVIQQRNA